MNPEWNRLARHLRPGDEQFVRGVDPTTAGLTLMLLAGAREMAQALFPRRQSDRGLAAEQHARRCAAIDLGERADG